MAQELTTSLIITLTDSAYTGDTGTGASILQVSTTETLNASSGPVLAEWRGPRRAIVSGASGVVFFPSEVTLPANARITMTFQVEYGSGDVTAVNRLLTWTRDTVVVETNEEIGSFSFDTSLTLARSGTETCYITPTYKVRA